MQNTIQIRRAYNMGKRGLKKTLVVFEKYALIVN